MVRREAAAVGLLCALALVTAGCGGEDAPSSASNPTHGPAEAYVEAALGFSVEEGAQLGMLLEERIAACMAQLGFEYVPDTSNHARTDLSAIDPPPGTREFAEHYGYGFAAMPDEMRTTNVVASPNDAIVAAMSPEQREAYERALWGEVAVSGEDGGELGGCFREARDEVFGDRERDPVRAALEDEIARIDAEAAPADPAVAEVAAAWSACMADAGHPGYARPDDAEAAAWDRWLAFNDGIGAAGGGQVEGDGEGGGGGGGGGVRGQVLLAADEAALATADWDCRAETGYDAVWAEVRSRLQQEYVDANRAELDAWVEAHSGGRAPGRR